GERAALEDRVQIGAGRTEGLAFVEVASEAEVTIGQCEDRLAVGEPVEVEPGLPEVPGLEVEPRLSAHRSSSSPRSSTTRTAPALALAETSAVGRPASRAASRYRREPGYTSTPSRSIRSRRTSFLRLPSPCTVAAADGSDGAPSGRRIPRDLRKVRTPSAR